MDRFSAYRTFVTVVAEGSLVKAAQKLNLTSSAISKQLSQLEHEMGVTLVSRTTRTLAVSDEGFEFYKDCVHLLKEAEEVEERLKSSLGRLVGKIRISWPQILMRGPLLPMLSAFSAAYPGIKIESVVSNRRVDLVDQDIDFAFRTFLDRAEGKTGPRLIESRTVMCAAPEYLKIVGEPKTIEDVLAANLIVPSYLNLSDLKIQLSQYGTFKNLERYSSIDDAMGYYHAIRAGMGFGHMQKMLIESDLKSGDLVEVLHGFKLRNVGIHLVANDKSPLTPKTLAFRDFAESWFDG